MLKRARKTPLFDETHGEHPSSEKRRKRVPLSVEEKQQKGLPLSVEEKAQEIADENSGANPPQDKKGVEKGTKVTQKVDAENSGANPPQDKKTVEKAIEKKQAPKKKKSGDVKKEEKIIEPEIIGRAEEDISPKDKKLQKKFKK